MLHIMLAAFLTAQGADTATTIWRLQAPNTHEMNVLLPQSSAGILAVKTGLTLTTAIAAWKMRHTHPKLAVALLAIGTVSGGYSAVHNIRLP